MLNPTHLPDSENGVGKYESAGLTLSASKLDDLNPLTDMGRHVSSSWYRWHGGHTNCNLKRCLRDETALHLRDKCSTWSRAFPGRARASTRASIAWECDVRPPLLTASAPSPYQPCAVPHVQRPPLTTLQPASILLSGPPRYWQPRPGW